MLKFIFGRACTGKTYRVLSDAAEMSADKKVIVIVPEQMSFETERAIALFEEANSENIEVLSFTKLCDVAFESAQRSSFAGITDFEKLILVKKAMSICKDELQLFSKYVNNREFVCKISDVIRDVKFSGVDHNTVLSVSKEIGGVCGAKLHDVALIMSVYDSLLSNKFIDASDKLTKLDDLLCDYPFFNGANVYFDAFTGFTGQQYKIITKIMEQCESVTFAFCTNDSDDVELNVFHNINSTVNRIKSIAKRRGVTIAEPTVLDKHYYSSDTLSALEEFFVSRSVSDKLSSENFKLISCLNPREETLAAVNLISDEVYKNGYRYKDFIITARNPDTYAYSLEKNCLNNDVACFMDKSVKLSDTLLPKFLIYLMEAASSMSTENIMKVLKTDLVSIDVSAVSELENYTYMWDIDFQDWSVEWIMSVNGLNTEEDSENDKKRLAEINSTRLQIVNTLTEFKNSFSGTPKNRIEALYKLFNKFETKKELLKFCNKIENDGDSYNSSLIKQSWDAVVEVFNSMVTVLDDCDIDNRSFIDVLMLGFESTSISNVPQRLDEVAFGGADRIRPSKPKISLILGANQGTFPAGYSQHGLFAAKDLELIRDYGIELDSDIIKSVVEENYLVYSLLCCPTDKTFVLFSRTNANGDPEEKSNFISEILDAFSETEVLEFSLTSSGEFLPHSPKEAFNNLGKFSDSDAVNVREALKSTEQYDEKLKELTLCEFYDDFTVSPQTANKLFGNDLSVSASKFDCYHKCSLSYLLRYGFKAKKLQKADLNVIQRGTIVHYVLENIIEKYKRGLAELSTIEINREVDKLIEDYVLQISGSDVIMTARFAFLLDRISKSVKEIIYHLAEEFAQTDFEPMFCELSIGDGGDIPKVQYVLEDGTNLYLEGKIDRVDVFENNVRVVDYKTGRMSFALSDTLFGLNMQMLLYLRAFIKTGGNLISNPKPAGVLYMSSSGDNTTGYKMNGVISDSDEIAQAMEKENKGRFIPKKTDKSKSYISEEMFELVFDKIDCLLKDMGANVKKGRFFAYPTDSQNGNACQFCDFASICRSSDKEHRSTTVYSNEEILSLLKEGESGGI